MGIIVNKAGVATIVQDYKLNPMNEGYITANHITTGQSVVLNSDGSLRYTMTGAYNCYSVNQGLIAAEMEGLTIQQKTALKPVSGITDF